MRCPKCGTNLLVKKPAPGESAGGPPPARQRKWTCPWGRRKAANLPVRAGAPPRPPPKAAPKPPPPPPPRAARAGCRLRVRRPRRTRSTSSPTTTQLPGFRGRDRAERSTTPRRARRSRSRRRWICRLFFARRPSGRPGIARRPPRGPSGPAAAPLRRRAPAAPQAPGRGRGRDPSARRTTLGSCVRAPRRPGMRPTCRRYAGEREPLLTPTEPLREDDLPIAAGPLGVRGLPGAGEAWVNTLTCPCPTGAAGGVGLPVAGDSRAARRLARRGGPGQTTAQPDGELRRHRSAGGSPSRGPSPPWRRGGARRRARGGTRWGRGQGRRPRRRVELRRAWRPARALQEDDDLPQAGAGKPAFGEIDLPLVSEDWGFFPQPAQGAGLPSAPRLGMGFPVAASHSGLADARARGRGSQRWRASGYGNARAGGRGSR